jgi:hypothetical protein
MDCAGKVTDVAFTVSDTDCPAASAGAVYVTEVFVMLLSVPCAGAVHATPAMEESLVTDAVRWTTVPCAMVDGLSAVSTTVLKFDGLLEHAVLQMHRITAIKYMNEDKRALLITAPPSEGCPEAGSNWSTHYLDHKIRDGELEMPIGHGV